MAKPISEDLRSRVAFIHPDDITAVTILALTTRKYGGESLPITGPEALSYADMTAKISAATSKPLRFEPISEDEGRRQMLENGDDATIVAAHVSIYRAIREGRLAGEGRSASNSGWTRTSRRSVDQRERSTGAFRPVRQIVRRRTCLAYPV